LRVLDLTRPPSTLSFKLDLSSHSDQYGTRLDAPQLVLEEGLSVDQLPVDRLVRDSVLLDLTSKTPGEPIDDEDLEGAEEEAGLTAREGEAVVIYTGWRPMHGQGFKSPVLSTYAAEYLEFKRVSMVAVDTPCLDELGEGTFSAHEILLRKNILVVENLTNLQELDQSRFRMIVLPLRLPAKATLVRALAFLDD